MSYRLVLIDGFFQLIRIIFLTEVIIVEVDGAFGVRLGFAELEPVEREAAAEKHEQQEDQRCIAFFLRAVCFRVCGRFRLGIRNRLRV